MSLIIKGVTVISLDDKGTILHNVDILIEGKKIVKLEKVPNNISPAVKINGKGLVAIPAFFNAHCHAPMTFERGWAEDLPLERWFNERIWVAESALTEDDVYWGAALAACEMIRSGCAGFNDHYFYMDRVAEIVETSGMKATLAWCQFGIGRDKEIGANLHGTLEFAKRWMGKGDGRIRTVLGPAANGARALGFADSGSIEIGKTADIALFDYSGPHLRPSHDIIANLIHSARGSDVQHLIIDGLVVMKNKKILTLDEEKIKAEAHSRARRMVEKNLRIVREYHG